MRGAETRPPRKPPNQLNAPTKILARPFGLPRWVNSVQYARSQVCFLSSFNYKVEASIGPDIQTLRPVLTVLDTGAGPNLIRADLLPPAALEACDKDREVVNLSSASNHRLETLGVLHLTVKIGNFTARQPFVVVRQLGADALLGCTFIDKHVQQVRPKMKMVELNDGTRAPIQRRPQVAATSRSSTENPRVRAPIKHSAKLRMCRRVIIPAGSELAVQVFSGTSGVRVLSPLPDLYSRKQICMANGLADIKPFSPFHVLVANFSSKSVTLSKNEVLALALPAPTKVFTVNVDPGAKTSSTAPKVGLAQVLTDDDSLARLAARVPESPAEPDSVTMDDVKLDHLANTEQDRVRTMLREFEGMWQGQLGNVSVTEHRIDLEPDARPVRLPPHRAGHKAREVEKAEVDEMLRLDVIEPAATEWSSPVVIVPKPDGKWRFCVDYRRLNAMSLKDSYPLPRMDECIDSLGDAKFFTALDCNWGFWQIPIREGDRDKTTFTCHSGTFRFKKMPFGLTNAPATFQRTIDIILAKFKWQSCLVYIDDIIVFSSSFDEHLRHVHQILTALKRSGLSLKLRKCSFFGKSVNYLGHTIRPGLLEVANKNTATIEGFKIPATQTNLRSFLGLCNVYRRFIPNYARAAAPLTELLTKAYGSRLPDFDERRLKSFNLLKSALASPPVLRLPRMGLRYSVDTDACDHQIGCALFQTHEDGKRYPLGFWSRQLRPAEKNYSAGEKECLAIIWAVQILQPYLQMEEFDLFTDHQALRWIFSLADGSNRLARWRLILMGHKFKVHYKKGAQNTVADAISRLPTFGNCSKGPELEIPCFAVHSESDSSSVSTPGTTEYEQDETTEWEEDFTMSDTSLPVMAVEEVTEVSPISIEEYIAAQASDAWCQVIAGKIDEGNEERFKRDDRGLLVRVAPLDLAHQVLVPKDLRPRVLHLSHYPRLVGHPGTTRMYQTLRRAFYWPAMALDVVQTVRSCIPCARERVKLRRHSGWLKLFPATRPLEFVSIDILGPLRRTKDGNENLLVITDRYSKLTRAVPLRSTTAHAVAQAFCDHWVFAYGPPAYLLSDNGQQFTAKHFQAVCQTLGIKNLFTAAYHPQTNGQAERYNRTILAALRAYVADHLDDWDRFAGALSYGYNTQVHRATGFSPLDLTVSRPPVHLAMQNVATGGHTKHRLHREQFLARLKEMMKSAGSSLRRAQARYKADFDRSVRPSAEDIHPGSLVFLRREAPTKDDPERNKLASLATGPYRVVKTSAKNLVIINASGFDDTVSRDRVVLAPPQDDGLSTPMDDRHEEERMRDERPSSVAIRSAPRQSVATEREEESDSDGEECVIDRIVTYDAELNRFRTRWFGYGPSDDTWQRPDSLPLSTLRSFFRKRKRNIPLQVVNALPQHLRSEVMGK